MAGEMRLDEVPPERVVFVVFNGSEDLRERLRAHGKKRRAVPTALDS